MVKADAAGVSLSDEAVQASFFPVKSCLELTLRCHETFWIKGLETMLQTLFNHNFRCSWFVHWWWGAMLKKIPEALLKLPTQHASSLLEQAAERGDLLGDSDHHCHCKFHCHWCYYFRYQFCQLSVMVTVRMLMASWRSRRWWRWWWWWWRRRWSRRYFVHSCLLVANIEGQKRFCRMAYCIMTTPDIRLLSPSFFGSSVSVQFPCWCWSLPNELSESCMIFFINFSPEEAMDIFLGATGRFRNDLGSREIMMGNIHYLRFM